MRPPGKKKAAVKKDAKKPTKKAAKKAVRKAIVHAKSAGNGVQPKRSGIALAGRIVTAPQLIEPKLARTRVADWLAGLAPAEAKSLKAMLATHPILSTLLESLAESSPYLWELASRDPKALLKLLGADPDRHLTELLGEYGRTIASSDDETEAMRLLRRMKAEASLLIALADIGGVWPVMRAARALTDLADTAVDAATRFVLAEAVRAGRLKPKDKTQPQIGSGYIVLAMGKMGAIELNYSSDIDLIVLYDQASPAVPKDTVAAPLFVRVTQRLVKLLQQRTADGYVFRTDLRLRPDPASTAIAISTAAAMSYYEGVGQNWERAAMIKARACAGDIAAGEAILRELSPFVWRKYLDFASVADVHAMKRQINAFRGHGEIAVEGHNVKLGRGGIREIEFFAQTQQLILGGRDPWLRDPSTLGALAALRARGHISLQAEHDLADAYRFLRNLEHRLQMIEDQQTHTLPASPDGIDHIARFMGFPETTAFQDALLDRLTRVQDHYARLFEREAPLATGAGSLVFTGVEEDPETLKTLTRLGFERAGDVSAAIRGWHHGRIRATRSARARELLTKLMPGLLEALAKTADPDSAFAHFDRFLSGLPAGVQVFSMLFANPRLLGLVAEIAGSAPRLAEYLGRHPSVMDALIDPEFLARIPNEEELRARFSVELARVAGYEAALDAARRFAKEETFRIGVQVIQGALDAEHAGPAYAIVAETLIAGLQDIVRREMETIHGRVAGGAFAVVAQGKLGGREMTAASDLDLVFIYTHDPEAGASDGAKPLAPGAYFARLSQRFIAGLTALTAEGRLFEVDMRLRPSGNQGPVAVKFDTFVSYHREKAWTWERMALTRARVIAGPAAFRTRIEEAISASFVTGCADPVTVLADARAMREKLAAQFPGRDSWDIKFAPGGLVDIEFIAQAFQLIGAGPDPSVLDQNTSVALSKLARAGTIDGADAEALIEAARREHGLTQALRIALDGPFKQEAATRGLKALLARAGNAPDFATLETRPISRRWKRNWRRRKRTCGQSSTVYCRRLSDSFRNRRVCGRDRSCRSPRRWRWPN